MVCGLVSSCFDEVFVELSVNLNHQEHSTAPVVKVANFKVSSLELELVQQTFNTNIAVRLASIDLKHFLQETNMVPIISTPFSSGGDQYLFNVNFTQVRYFNIRFSSLFCAM